MKLMNEIESDVAGEVVRRIATSGQPVEYGQPLFAIHAREERRKTPRIPVNRKFGRHVS